MGCLASKPKEKPINKEVQPLSPPTTDRPHASLLASQGTLLTKSTMTRYIHGGVSKDYDIRETIALRPYFQLKKCMYLPTGEIRVAKIIHKSEVLDEDLMPDQTLREVSLLRKLDHPSISRLYEAFEDKFRFYLIEEFVPGKDLLSFLADTPRVDIRAIMWQILTTIDYIHTQGAALLGLDFNSLQLATSDQGVSVKITDFSSAVCSESTATDGSLKRSSPCTAPEVFAGRRWKEADLWSCGVIFHVLLFGKPPYTDSEKPDVMDKVRTGSVTLGDVSELDPEQRELLLGLLEKSPRSRWSAQRALGSAWVSGKAIGTRVPPDRLERTVLAMRSFTASYKLKDAIFTFLSFQVISSSETRELNEVFLHLDRNGDAKVSRDELLSYFKENCRTTDALREVEDMLAHIDSDNSGFIEYAEFLKASLDVRKFASKQYLELAFRAFDVDGSGKISVGDLKAMVGNSSRETEAFVKSLIEEADFNKDGEIDLTEFQTIALRKF